MTQPTVDKSQRPSVTIHAQTATSIGIEILTKEGGAWIVVEHESITIAPKNLEVEVKP
jgi:hypothetical protein